MWYANVFNSCTVCTFYSNFPFKTILVSFNLFAAFHEITLLVYFQQLLPLRTDEIKLRIALLSLQIKPAVCGFTSTKLLPRSTSRTSCKHKLWWMSNQFSNYSRGGSAVVLLRTPAWSSNLLSCACDRHLNVDTDDHIILKNFQEIHTGANFFFFFCYHYMVVLLKLAQIVW